MSHVVLVDAEDNEVGTMEKMEAHRKGVLHRAFSILLFNSKGEFLIQKRAPRKYHSAGLWSNTCCSHPEPGESMDDATRRSLRFEMGIDLETTFVYKFLYQISLDGGLQEHEFDYVFTGVCDQTPVVNDDEVSDWKFIDRESLLQEIAIHPEAYSHWFKVILQNLILPDIR